MADISFIFILVFVLLVASQGLLVGGFVRALLRGCHPLGAQPAGVQPAGAQPLPTDDQCPKAAVILCLRGTDPFLPKCIEALLNLDYPCYEVKIIVDSADDPAWRIADETVTRLAKTNIEMIPLTERHNTCSLKCSSILQAVSHLDHTHEVLAQLDADTVAHPTWLRELVAPLAGDQVGAATGNRWYMPENGAWGSLIRYVWNAAAVVQMYWYRIAWGGTLAIKTEVLRNSDLLARWSHAFCEDTMLFTELRKQGLRVAFVPALMMVNRESCDIGGYFRWVRRQLLTARLYHPGWPAVVGHGIITSLVVIVSVGALATAGLAQRWEFFCSVGIGFLCYQAAIALLLVPMEIAVRRIVAVRDEPTHWFTTAIAFKYLPTVALTQILYAAALASALWIRTVDWRGITYQIHGPWRIHLTDDRPYVAEEPGDEVGHSL